MKGETLLSLFASFNFPEAFNFPEVNQVPIQSWMDNEFSSRWPERPQHWTTAPLINTSTSFSRNNISPFLTWVEVIAGNCHLLSHSSSPEKSHRTRNVQCSDLLCIQENKYDLQSQIVLKHRDDMVKTQIDAIKIRDAET